MAGFFQNGICFPTQQEAIDTHYQSQPTITSFNGVDTFIFKYVRAADGSWTFNKSDLSGATTSSIPLDALTFSSCESPTDHTTSFLNGVELGWAVASAVVIAFVLRRLRRGF